MKEALSSPKRQFLQEPRGVTSQKTPFFIVTAVKTSNLIYILHQFNPDQNNVAKIIDNLKEM
jgi:hypothetical protein